MGDFLMSISCIMPLGESTAGSLLLGGAHFEHWRRSAGFFVEP